MPTTPPAAHTRVWCDHGAAHPWVASHTDERGQIIDVIGRADTRQAARALTTMGRSSRALLADSPWQFYPRARSGYETPRTAAGSALEDAQTAINPQGHCEGDAR